MKSIFTVLLSLSVGVLSAQQRPMFIGTYTNEGSQGIYQYTFDTKTGEAELYSTTNAEHPSFLALAKGDKMLYAVNETGDNTAALSAFTFDGESLSFVNTVPTHGTYPCHVAVSRKYPLAVVANYGGGSLTVYRLEPNGAIGEVIQQIKQEGVGPNKDRQNASHVHSAFFSPDEKRVYVQNLGTDEISIYKIQKDKDDYQLIEEVVLKAPAGGGPRHLAIDKKEKNLYVLMELTGEVAHYQNKGGKWELQQSLSMNEDGFAGENGAAEIKLSADGKFVYATNRGDANSITVFEVLKGGALQKKVVYSTKGEGPRNFNFSPDGKYILVANQGSHNIVVFERDAKTGELRDIEKEIQVPTPVCIVF